MRLIPPPGDYLPHRSMMRAYASAAQAISASTNTKIVLDYAEYDAFSDFNTGTYRFTAPAAGKYIIQASVGLLALAASYYLQAWISKNESPIMILNEGQRDNIGNVILPLNGTLMLAQSDTITLWVWHNDTVSRNTNNQQNVTFMTVYRIA